MAKKEKIISPLDIHGLTFYHLPRWLSGKGVGKAGDTDLIFGWGRSPGGGNGTHSSILAWEIPWTEEPGGLQCRESQRAGHD